MKFQNPDYSFFYTAVLVGQISRTFAQAPNDFDFFGWLLFLHITLNHVILTRAKHFELWGTVEMNIRNLFSNLRSFRASRSEHWIIRFEDDWYRYSMRNFKCSEESARLKVCWFCLSDLETCFRVRGAPQNWWMNSHLKFSSAHTWFYYFEEDIHTIQICFHFMLQIEF